MEESLAESTREPDFIESLVAFIDILGFKNRVESSEDVSSLRLVVKALEVIQRKFDFNSGDKITNELQEIVHKKVLAFSDSIVVAVGYDAEGYSHLGSFDFLLSEIVGIARAQAECVSQGIFLRGGIDEGLWYYQNDRMVSPALITAHELEGKVWAPVIGLSQRLYDKFAQHQDRKTYAKDWEPFASEVRGFEKEGKNAESREKYWFIDYMRIYLHEFEKPTDQIRWLLEHAQAIKDGFESSPDDESIKDKYRWLSSYHNEVILEYRYPDDLMVHLSGQQYETYPADPPS